MFRRSLDRLRAILAGVFFDLIASIFLFGFLGIVMSGHPYLFC